MADDATITTPADSAPAQPAVAPASPIDLLAPAAPPGPAPAPVAVAPAPAPVVAAAPAQPAEPAAKPAAGNAGLGDRLATLEGRLREAEERARAAERSAAGRALATRFVEETGLDTSIVERVVIPALGADADLAGLAGDSAKRAAAWSEAAKRPEIAALLKMRGQGATTPATSAPAGRSPGEAMLAQLADRIKSGAAVRLTQGGADTARRYADWIDAGHKATQAWARQRGSGPMVAPDGSRM